jgi:multidrug efflux system membrane fusion protein
VAAKKADAGVPATVTKVLTKDVPLEIQVIGNVEASSTITVKAQVSGELLNVHFQEGDYVKSGDLLFTIDRRLLDAQLGQAQGNLARARAAQGQAQANLGRDQANLNYLNATAKRYEELFKEGIFSKEQGELARSNAEAAAQSINADQAAIASAVADIASTQAAIDNLKVQLTFTEIRSPINGRTGTVLVKQGNLVVANQTELVTINQVEPIFVTYSIPEAQLREVKKYREEKPLAVVVRPQDNDEVVETGSLKFIDNAVDMTTGTIKLKGLFQNAARRLWPGEFVRVTMRLTTRVGATVVPNQVVQTGQDGTYAFVVKPDNSVEARKVATGPRFGEDLVIESGLQPGETVVLEGQLRLAPGLKIAPREPRSPKGATAAAAPVQSGAKAGQ